jgi:hypothetical protein
VIRIFETYRPHFETSHAPHPTALPNGESGG